MGLRQAYLREEAQRAGVNEGVNAVLTDRTDVVLTDAVTDGVGPGVGVVLLVACDGGKRRDIGPDGSNGRHATKAKRKPKRQRDRHKAGYMRAYMAKRRAAIATSANPNPA